MMKRTSRRSLVSSYNLRSWPGWSALAAFWFGHRGGWRPTTVAQVYIQRRSRIHNRDSHRAQRRASEQSASLHVAPVHSCRTMEKTIVLITGANTGVGFEAVKQFYAAETPLPTPKPYHILLGGRSRDKVDEAVQRVKEELGSGPARGEVEGVVIDITSDESIQALAGLVEGKFGRIDVLINNAGGSDVSWVTQG